MFEIKLGVFRDDIRFTLPLVSWWRHGARHISLTRDTKEEWIYYGHRSIMIFFSKHIRIAGRPKVLHTFASSSTIIRFFDNCSWISMTFSTPRTTKYPPGSRGHSVNLDNSCKWLQTSTTNQNEIVHSMVSGIAYISLVNLCRAPTWGPLPVRTQLELRNIMGIRPMGRLLRTTRWFPKTW